MWILLFSLFGTGCAESLQKSNEDMTMQILNALFLMTCTNYFDVYPDSSFYYFDFMLSWSFMEHWIYH